MRLAFRWHEESGFWKIDIYLMPVQLVGGDVDGAIVDPGYSLDMTVLQKEFEHIDNVSCNTHGYHGTKPPFVSVEGIYQG